MNTYDNEIPKRIKKKESRVSKAKKKSKHKHQYAECLIRYKNQDYYHDKEWMVTELKTYCTICGKVYYSNRLYDTGVYIIRKILPYSLK